MAVGPNPKYPPADEYEAEVQREMVDPADDETCYLCYELLTWPWIYWNSGGNIYLHPQCALRFASHLITDAQQIMSWYEMEKGLREQP